MGTKIAIVCHLRYVLFVSSDSKFGFRGLPSFLENDFLHTYTILININCILKFIVTNPNSNFFQCYWIINITYDLQSHFVIARKQV